MTLSAVSKYIIVEPTKADEVSKGGIVLPVEAQERPDTGKITDLGEDVTINIRVGDTVVFAKYSGVTFDKFRILKQDEILGVLT